MLGIFLRQGQRSNFVHVVMIILLIPSFGFFQHLQTALDSVVQENSDLLNKVRQLHQELVTERSMLCQATADKMDTEHKLHVSYT